MKTDLLTFLDASPTAFHAVKYLAMHLKKEGYQELKEENPWALAFGGKYFVIRNGSLAAFQTPNQEPTSFSITATHTDSPSFKLKNNPEFVKDHMVMLGLEVYGSPLIPSFFNRDLQIAGRVFFLDKKGQKNECLINLHDYPVIIPSLAIHLETSEKGFNKQDHVAALFGLDLEPPCLETLLKTKLNAKEILSFDLFLSPLEKASLIGYNQEMIASYRLDNLLSAHASITALTNSKKPSLNTVKAAVFFNHEEVGSMSDQGAHSPFLTHLLERICTSLHLTREDYFRLLAKSMLISVDLAHALHPNYPEKHEPRHQPLLNKGIIIKQNAALRYASSADSISCIVELCQKNQIPYQYFVSRNDMPCGSTIGPIVAAATGIKTVDIGMGQLSMHSCREIAALNDHLNMCKLLSAFYHSHS